VAEVSDFLGTLTQEDVGDFLKAVAEPEPAPAEFLTKVEPTVVPNRTIRLNKKFKGK